MAKLLIVTPNRELYDIAMQVVTEAYIIAEVIQAASDNVVTLVKEAFAGDTGVVVARGNHAHLIKTQLDIPVVDVVLTGQDMAMLLERACQMLGNDNPRIAFVGFRYMFSNCEPIARILKADVRIYYASTTQTLPDVVDRAKKEGAQLIIGGEIACKEAEGLGLDALFMDSTLESMRDAVRVALYMLEVLNIEKRKTAEFMSLVNYSFDAILKLDAQGRILIVNYMAEKVLHMPASQLIGQHFSKLPGIRLSAAFEEAFAQRKSAYASIIRLGGESFVANIADIAVDKRNNGYIISMQEFGAIDDLEERVRLERYSLGYFAKARFADSVTQSTAMAALYEDATQYAQYDVPLLLCGPAGSDADTLAECIHNASVYQRNPFVAINLSVIPRAAQQDLIFGSDEPGGGRGQINLAQKGTLYLKHIDLLTKDAQQQLLEVLMHGRYRRGGSQTFVPVSVRVLCATQKDLFALVEKGLFLEPLYQEIVKIALFIPPLCQRAEDVPQLIEKSMAHYAAKYKKRVALTADAFDYLAHYPWPGDMAELGGVCAKMTLLARDNLVDSAFVQNRVLVSIPEKAQGSAPILVVSNDEEKALRSAAMLHGGNRDAIAAALGISKTTLWRRMKKYGLQ